MIGGVLRSAQNDIACDECTMRCDFAQNDIACDEFTMKCVVALSVSEGPLT